MVSCGLTNVPVEIFAITSAPFHGAWSNNSVPINSTTPVSTSNLAVLFGELNSWSK